MLTLPNTIKLKYLSTTLAPPLYHSPLFRTFTKKQIDKRLTIKVKSLNYSSILMICLDYISLIYFGFRVYVQNRFINVAEHRYFGKNI